MIRPPALRAHPRVALVAPAGPLPEGAIDRALERLRGWGWEPQVGAYARGRLGFLAGTDEERLSDLNAALRAPDNDAVWCLRGGYGTMRILDRVDWAALRARPRPLVGFSDNTALHLAAWREGLVSFHGPHPAAAETTAFSLAGLRSLLTETRPAGVLPFPEGSAGRAATLVAGVAEGPLVGGNLSLLCATLGTPYAVQAEGTILFLEEVGEPLYRMDRLLSQLRLAGVLRGVAGVAVGAFSECPDEGRPGMPSTLDLLADHLTGLGVPVAVGFPVGHVPDNWTLPLGVRARLDATGGALGLLEAAVV